MIHPPPLRLNYISSFSTNPLSFSDAEYWTKFMMMIIMIMMVEEEGEEGLPTSSFGVKSDNKVGISNAKKIDSISRSAQGSFEILK